MIPAAETQGRYFLIREYAELLDVVPKTVRGWIDSGELKAVNVARRQGGRPRWRIRPADANLFESARSSRPDPKPARRTRTKALPVVEEYYQ